MSATIIQTSFNSGEWAPALNARVDLEKYHSGAALLRNFFVDYRGGATARAGTRYILQTRLTSTTRLIRFQASFTVTYVLEFGNNYIRFYNNGAPVLELATTISSATQANPGVITDTAHGYANGDWIFISGVAGMTQLNNNYYIIANATANTYTLTDLNGNAINTTLFGAYTSGGQAKRVYTLLNTPYLATELAQIKFAQNVNTLILCHPNHPPYQLVLNSATNWTLSAISFVATINPPSFNAATTWAGGTFFVAYVMTSVDANGQESAPSTIVNIGGIVDPRTTAGSTTLGRTTTPAGAVSFNVYKTDVRDGNPIVAGMQFGFAGNFTGVSFFDSGISPDFSQGPPIIQNPFSGTGVQTLVLNARGNNFNAVPVVTFTAAPPGGVTAAASCTLSAVNVSLINSGGSGYSVGNIITLQGGTGLALGVTSVNFLGGITGFNIQNFGTVLSGTAPTSGLGVVSGSAGSGAIFQATWGVSSITLNTAGAGYLVAPTVGFVGGGGSGASATATLGAPSAGNPTVPGFFQQRLFLAGPVGSPQQFNASQPGSYYNFNTSFPLEGDDAIQGTLVSGTLNTIQNLISQPQGLIMLADQQAWLINGGSPGSAISATQIVANSQAYNGSGLPPAIVANDNILYVQAKGSIVRDLVFNFYTQVYTGTDISVLSSHLFYGFQILEWAWAEEPFKVVWAVRNDGDLLALTFLKEQELIAWTHSDTQGSFMSVASVTETVGTTAVDAVYLVVQRIINGNTVNYVERMTEQTYTNGVTDAWCVDSGLQFNGTASLSFSGAQNLAGATVTGLATDDLGNVTVITPFAMPVSGTFTLPAPTPVGSTGYTRVTVGLAYTPQLQTLQLDTGQPTIQGKMKSIPLVTVRVNQTLGLSIGKTFSTLVAMKDLIPGNVGSATNTVVSGLVTGDAMTFLDPSWTVPGQYCIQQSLPYPASILGVIPQIADKDIK